MSTAANRLYQWMTKEMSVLPGRKDSKKENIPLTVADMEFLVQGQGEKLWEHVEKHVYPREKVDKIRKNILLNRLRNMKSGKEIEKNDNIGNHLKLLLEIRNIRSSIYEERRTIKNIEEKCNKLNSTLQVTECKRQCLKNQSCDIQKRIILLQLAEDTNSSKMQVCQTSDKFFNRLKSEQTKDPDSSQKTSFSVNNESRRKQVLSYFENNEDLSSKAECLDFLHQCNVIAKDLVEDKCKRMHFERSSRSHHVDGFEGKECDISNFEKKKKDLRKYVSENVHRVQRQLLHGLLLGQTSKGVADLAGWSPVCAFGNDLRFLGTKINGKDLKVELDKKFTNLYYETTSSMMSYIRERNISSNAEKALISLMAQVETELKKIFTIETAWVEKAYELVKIKAEVASLNCASSYKDEFILKQNSDSSRDTNWLKELGNLPDEAQLKQSLEVLKIFKENIQGIVTKNHAKFQMVMGDMNCPDFLEKVRFFILEGGLINQEITSFTGYPLEYHAKTNVYGTLIPDFKLLNNGSSWPNHVCLGANGSEDEVFNLCTQATMGHLPHSSSEMIILEAFKSRLFRSEAGAVELPKLCIDDHIKQSRFARTPDLLLELQKKEESMEEMIKHSREIVKSHNNEAKSILDKTEFILSNWCENTIHKCIPESIVYEGKPYRQWYQDYLDALYKASP